MRGDKKGRVNVRRREELGVYKLVEVRMYRDCRWSGEQWGVVSKKTYKGEDLNHCWV